MTRMEARLNNALPIKYILFIRYRIWPWHRVCWHACRYRRFSCK